MSKGCLNQCRVSKSVRQLRSSTKAYKVICSFLYLLKYTTVRKCEIRTPGTGTWPSSFSGVKREALTFEDAIN